MKEYIQPLLVVFELELTNVLNASSDLPTDWGTAPDGWDSDSNI